MRTKLRTPSVFIIAIALAAVVVTAGCTQQQQEPITEIFVSGHGNTVYTFNNDIRESILVKASSEQQIQNLFFTSQKMNIIFDGTDGQDNALFRVVLIDMSKIPIYLTYEGNIVSVDHFYYIKDNSTDPSTVQWFDSGGQKIDEPSPEGVSIKFLGPNTGATETSVSLSGNTVTVQGQDLKNLSMAADKLTLIVFGISDISQIEGALT